MTLISEYGRINRAAIVARARQIYATTHDWTAAMRRAHEEASAQLRAHFRPAPIAIRREAARA